MHLVSIKQFKDKVSVYTDKRNNKVYKVNGKLCKVVNRKLKALMWSTRDLKDKGFTFEKYTYL